MSAMLEDAVLCFQKALIAPGKRTNRLAREAEAWLFSEDEHWPFSFLNVCAVLGIDPHYFRKGLLQWRQRRLQRLQGKTTQRIPAPQEYKTAA
jgi:hypothetical protein